MGSYAGVDWAADKHDVVVQDEAGGELLAATFAHDEKGLRALCRQLVRLGVELVAIEPTQEIRRQAHALVAISEVQRALPGARVPAATGPVRVDVRDGVPRSHPREIAGRVRRLLLEHDAFPHRARVDGRDLHLGGALLFRGCRGPLAIQSPQGHPREPAREH